MDVPGFGTIDSSWRPALTPLTEQLASIATFIDSERTAGFDVLPRADHVLRALTLPIDQVKVLIVGQDPYPTPGHACGLSFSVNRDVRPLPRSLTNIYRELSDDLGIVPPEHGDLSGWSDQGVLLLNRCLTVRAHNPGSHRNQGWEIITGAILEHLAARNQPLVAILWGRDAQDSARHLPGVSIISSAHPSPLSARRGFFGSRPFSRANELLVNMSETPINWEISR